MRSRRQAATSFRGLATQVCQTRGTERDNDALPNDRHDEEHSLEHVDIQAWVRSETQRLNLPRDLASEASTSSSSSQAQPQDRRPLLCDLAELYEVEKRFYTRRAQFELEKAEEIFRYDQALVAENIGKWDGDEDDRHTRRAQAMGNDSDAARSSPDASGALAILAQGFREKVGDRDLDQGIPKDCAKS